MPLTFLFAITAVLEALTGVALILLPDIVARILLGNPLSASGLAVGRLAGIALLALAVMAWMGHHTSGRSPALAAMLTYNFLAGLYLATLDAEIVGRQIAVASGARACCLGSSASPRLVVAFG